jgi:glycosyltransferase involved in cell wall biosynthesis
MSKRKKIARAMTTLHLAIDLRVIDATGMDTTGVGRYALETTRALQQVRRGWRFSLMSNRQDLGLLAENATVVTTRLPTNNAAARVAWLHTASLVPMIRRRPDVWFSPAFVLPLWWRGKAVVTVHDLTFLLLRHRYRGTLNSFYATAATRWSVRRADSVLCGSNATRELLVAHLNADVAKVSVIPYGVSEAFFASFATAPLSGPNSSDTPYVLFVGTREARKGLATLHAALQRVNSREQRIRLVLAGQDGWGTERILQDMRASPSVVFCERPSDHCLASLYRHALALVYPSEMEGFGIPVAEAMACGCAVIASDLASIREFAGGYPRYIAVGDDAELSLRIEELLQGDSQAQGRRMKAQELASRLTWPRLAEETASIIEHVVHGSPRDCSVAPPN